MEVDLRLDPFDAKWTEVLDAVSAVADAGFAGIWTPDHLDGRVFGGARVLECWTTLTAIAASTPEIKVGPLVLNVANYDLVFKGQVRHAALDVGLGIEFREVRKGDRAVLQHLLQKIEHRRTSKEKADKHKASSAGSRN